MNNNFLECLGEVAGTGGFLRAHRMTLQNHRQDNTLSKKYSCEYVTRDFGMAAVAVVLYHQGEAGTEVLLRRGLRPPLLSIAESPWSVEIVAGIVEPTDVGTEGIRRRAVAETEEEAGYIIKTDQLVPLGPASYPCPGVFPETIVFFAAEIAEKEAGKEITGDGSPMEEGATCEWVDLAEALQRCQRGQVTDMKTELGLRRLKDLLSR